MTINNKNIDANETKKILDGITLIKVDPLKYLDVLGCTLVDYYIHLKMNDRYAPISFAGMPFDEKKQEKLKAHTSQDIFIHKDDVMALSQSLGKTQRRNEGSIRHTQTKLLAPILSGEITKPELEKLGDEILTEVLPNPTVDLISQASQFIAKKNDVKAITGIVILVAIGNGFATKQIHSELTLSAILMDASLTMVDESTLELYYSRSDKMTDEMKLKFQNHPLESVQLINTKLEVSETIKNLILHHHERKDGLGFPKGLRGSAVSQLDQILGLAVDIFEEQKYRLITNFAKADLLTIIFDFQKNLKEGSNKYHPKLFEGIIRYINQRKRSNAA